MNGTLTKQRFKLQWKKFLASFTLWALGIPINVIPVLFKQLRDITARDFPGVCKLALLTLGDFEFSFISVSVLFILCIEGYFVDEKVSPQYRGFRVCSFVCFCSFLLLYCVFFFRPDLFSAMTPDTQVIYNAVIIIITIVLGGLCNAGISMKESGAK